MMKLTARQYNTHLCKYNSNVLSTSEFQDETLSHEMGHICAHNFAFSWYLLKMMNR